MSKFNDDILQPIANNELSQLIGVLKENLPKNLRAHHFLLMQLKWKTVLNTPTNHHLADKISARCKFNIFKHRNGNRKNCTFVAITLEGKPEFIDVRLIT